MAARIYSEFPERKMTPPNSLGTKEYAGSTENGNGGKGFITEGPLQPTNQTAKIWLIYWFGALTCNCRRHLGKLTGITG